MRAGNAYRLSFACAVLYLGTAAATPLLTAGDPQLPSAPAWAPLSAEQIAGSASAFDLDPKSAAISSLQNVSESSATELVNPVDLRSAGTGLNLQEQLRRFVNVQPGSGGAPAHGRARRPAGGDGPDLGIDLGEATEQWIRDSVQDLLGSILKLEVNDRGRASFSVLGVGDFSVTVGAGGSSFVLSQGDDVLLVAQRPIASGTSAIASANDMPLVGAVDVRYPAGEASSLRQALDLAIDIATHPVSVLVYCIVIAYMLLWSLLSRQKHAGSLRHGGHAEPGMSAAAVGSARPASRSSAPRTLLDSAADMLGHASSHSSHRRRRRRSRSRRARARAA